MNRSVDGDYDNLRLKVGANKISWSGSVTKIIINNYSRWI
jgi:phage-related protein